MKLNVHFFKSLQFWLGLALAGGAVAALILLGGVLNPAPIGVVVAQGDIQRGDLITRDMLVVSEQQLNPSLASYYVQAHEVTQYLGAVAVDNIYKGDPLAKLRLAAGQDIEKARRLSAALEDPTKVIRAVTVSPNSCPDLVYPGDVVEIGFSLGGQTARQIGPTPTPQGGHVSVVATPQARLELPASKIVLRDVLVLRVEHEKVRNPNYGSGLGTEGDSEPMYLKGDVERLVVLVDETDTEMLDFALHNGEISVGLRSYLVRQEVEDGREQPPTMGVTWTDFSDWFLTQRISATLYLSNTVEAESAEAIAEIRGVSMARGLDAAHKPVQPTEVYGPGDDFYFSAPLAMAEGESVAVRWSYGGELIHQEQMAAEGEPLSRVWGKLANTEPWPAGAYRVALYDGSGQEVAAAEFWVEER